MRGYGGSFPRDHKGESKERSYKCSSPFRSNRQRNEFLRGAILVGVLIALSFTGPFRAKVWGVAPGADGHHNLKGFAHQLHDDYEKEHHGHDPHSAPKLPSKHHPKDDHTGHHATHAESHTHMHVAAKDENAHASHSTRSSAPMEPKAGQIVQEQKQKTEAAYHQPIAPPAADSFKKVGVHQQPHQALTKLNSAQGPETAAKIADALHHSHAETHTEAKPNRPKSDSDSNLDYVHHDEGNPAAHTQFTDVKAHIHTATGHEHHTEQHEVKHATLKGHTEHAQVVEHKHDDRAHEAKGQETTAHKAKPHAGGLTKHAQETIVAHAPHQAEHVAEERHHGNEAPQKHGDQHETLDHVVAHATHQAEHVVEHHGHEASVHKHNSQHKAVDAKMATVVSVEPKSAPHKPAHLAPPTDTVHAPEHGAEHKHVHRHDVGGK